jgi:hypothetical protein
MAESLPREERIQLAIEALDSGQIRSIRSAATTFDIPSTTIHNRLRGRVPRQEAQVTNRKLSSTEEEALVQWIDSMDQRGMSPSFSYIRQMADLLIFERGSMVLADASVLDASTATVGENWVRRFLNRHDELKSRYNRKYDYQRALCEDPAIISPYFERVRKTIESYGIPDDDIYNFDETGFQMGVASTAKVVTRADRHGRPVVVQPGNREWSTVIDCVNALGWSLPPMIILQGKVHLSTWYEGSPLPRDWHTVGITHGYIAHRYGHFVFAA